MTEMDYTEIIFDREDAVGILTLNNAGKVNALSKRMIGEILNLLDSVIVDDTLKEIYYRTRASEQPDMQSVWIGLNLEQ